MADRVTIGRCAGCSHFRRHRRYHFSNGVYDEVQHWAKDYTEVKASSDRDWSAMKLVREMDEPAKDGICTLEDKIGEGIGGSEVGMKGYAPTEHSDELNAEPPYEGGVYITVGENFGCIHFTPKE